FSSILFLFLYLPIVLFIYHLLFFPVSRGWQVSFWRRACNLFLLSVSLLFYFWGENFLLWIVITSTLIDYFCGLLIAGGFSRKPLIRLRRKIKRTGVQKAGLIFSICSNLAFLGFFKYFNFGIDNFNSLMGSLNLTALQWNDAAQITLPLGISFYTFQSMSYTIDVYRGKVRATRNLIDFSCYVTMFPQLVAGPIVRYKDVARQLVHRVITTEKFASGISRFVVGLGKKVIIANTVALPADQIFALPAQDISAPLAWIGLLCYTLQIYFDFSGYSDMAIGLGRMFGFEFLENFNYPYIARSIQEFWRRWHISLSSWFRDYLYIPLGGNQCSTFRTYFNLVTVFFLCGLWHGASWAFAVWGLYHGMFLVIERMGFSSVLKRTWSPARHLYTLLVAMVGWVFFRADTLTYAIDFLTAMSGLGPADPRIYPVGAYCSLHVALALVLGVIGSAPILPAINRWVAAARAESTNPLPSVLYGGYQILSLTGLCLIMLMVAMSLALGAYNPFIYFRF
ncbi:MAG: MBOAT family O-acyltransferase, partial [Planctomycetota bacterium]